VVGDLLKSASYDVLSFPDASQFLTWFAEFAENCSAIILITGYNKEERAKCIEAGADLMKSEKGKAMLRPHRAQVSVLFTDIRGFTAFANAVPPEQVMDVLSKYYAPVGHAALKYSGTIGSIAAPARRPSHGAGDA
jgi:hypothetical protein